MVVARVGGEIEYVDVYDDAQFNNVVKSLSDPPPAGYVPCDHPKKCSTTERVNTFWWGSDRYYLPDNGHQPAQEAPTAVENWPDVIAARRYVFDYDNVIDLDPIPCLLHRPDDRGLFPEKRISWIAGQPGCGKSWIVYFAIMEALLQGGRVLYIDTDDIGDNFKRRTRILGGKGVFDQPRFFYCNESPNRYAHNYEPDDPLHDPLHHALCKWLEASEGPRVVVIDSAFSSGADSSGASIAQWAYDRIDPWKEQEPTIIVVDHVPKRDKPGNRTGRGGIGSQDKLALVTGVSYFVPTLKCWTDTLDGRITLVVDKDKTTTTGVQPLTPYATFVGTWHDTPAGRAFDWTAHVPDEPAPDDNDDGTSYEDRIATDIHNAVAAAQDGLTITTIRKAVRGKTGTIGVVAERMVYQNVLTKTGNVYRIAPPTLTLLTPLT